MRLLKAEIFTDGSKELIECTECKQHCTRVAALSHEYLDYADSRVYLCYACLVKAASMIEDGF